MGYLYTQIARFFETSMLSVGVHITTSIAGIFFFGFPVAFSFGAYALVILIKNGFTLWIAFIITILLSVLLGLIFSLLYRRLSNDGFAVFTFASVLAFDSLIKSWDSLTGGVLGISGISRPSFARTLVALVILQGILAICVFIFEYTLLQSPFGRALRAHNESKIFLDATGIPASGIGSFAITLAVVLSALAGILAIWRIQFLDPSFGGIAILLQILTIGILAMKPKVSGLILSVLCIVLLPEILRFFPFPSSIMGHLRILFYSVLLIVLVKQLSTRYTSKKRFI
ncbi:MAG: branched-chain amino acid ABC transporter permease [Candidatus Paceibacterota bacterium]